MPKIISELNISDAASAILAGELLINIAARIGINPDVLSKKLRARGIVIPKRVPAGHNKLTNLPEKLIIDEYLRGISELALAQQFKISRGTIAKILIRNNIIRRTGSEANFLRMAKLTAVERTELISFARQQRIENMITAVHSNILDNPAIGIGEREIAQSLEFFGHSVVRQKIVGAYMLDIAVGNVAVEVKFSARSLLHRIFKREKYIVESDFRLVYVLIDSINCVNRHLNHLISYVDFACRYPPAAGQYRVIRCDGTNNTPRFYVRDRAIVGRSPKILTTVEQV